MSKFFEYIIAFEGILVAIITLASTLAGFWVKKHIQKKSASRELEEATHKNENILRLLKTLLEEVQCDRAYIFEFHNGTYFSSGLPIQKFTCSYEVVDEGISSECSNPGEYRVSNFNSYIKKIITERDVCIPNVNDIVEHPLLKGLLEEKGVKSLYNIPIRDISGKTIGFIGVDFVKNQINLDEVKINFIRSCAKLVTGYIAK